MNSTTVSRNKLLVDVLPSGLVRNDIAEIFSPARIKSLADKNIRSILILSSEAVDPHTYPDLIEHFRNSGFNVHTSYIESMDRNNLNNMKILCSDIHTSLGKGGCLIVSYRSPYVFAVIASYYIFSGRNVDDALRLVQNIGGGAAETGRYRYFLTEFQVHIKRTVDDRESIREAIKIIDTGQEGPGVTRPAATFPGTIENPEQSALVKNIEDIEDIEEQQDIQQAETERVKHETTGKTDAATVMPAVAADAVSGMDETDKITIEKTDLKKEAKAKKDKSKKTGSVREKTDTAPAPEEPAAAISTGPFYRSIRFKLVTIISIIITLSLTGMIFVATYFFLEDNKVRVQENNLKISEVIALKLKSEIEKYQVLSTNLLTSGKKVKESGIVSGAEKDIIFTGIITRKDNLKNPVFSKTYFNRQLLNRFQISDDNLKNAHTSASEYLRQSFAGETVIYNISPYMEQPVLAITLPYEKNRNRIPTSIQVSYVKLESILNTFKSTGITEVFMINHKGDVIAHFDNEKVVSGANLANIPICKKMMSSKIDNGQTRFSDEKGIFKLGSFKKIGIGGSGIIATVEEDKAFKAVYNIRRWNLTLTAIILVGAILFVFLFGNTITAPIIKLVGATRKIIQGQYQVDIRPSTKDEVGQLTSTFIEMGKGLEEREKIKSAFGKFVNKEIAEAALHGELRLGGERKDVTIFFSDIRSFTEISESLEPEEVVEFLNDYMTRMVKCVEKTDGIVDKFIGDAIMAIWGTPISRGNDTENAIRSALLMRKELNDFNRQRGGEGKPIIKIGCGINTGPALAGQIGSEDRMEYTVIGDSVNLASRIEALNKPFGTDILISQDAFKQVRDLFEVEKMKRIKVKGKAEPQQIYAVLGEKDNPENPGSVDELRKLLGTSDMMLGDMNTNEIIDDGEVKYEIIE